MPKQQTLNKLRQAIIKEIPEIVELKVGCEIEINRNADIYMRKHLNGRKAIYFKSDYSNYTFFIVPDYPRKTLQNIELNGKYKIIGRKITLADVLRVVCNKFNDGQYVVMSYKKVTDILRLWDFTQNDLNLQSEETVGFLAKIILKEDE